jgi:hypothetical protein
MNEETPTWLKIMQNGNIGEARTKSLLMDRFWILERSVDIDGADFLIQRRLTSRNISDYNFRLGVIQVKFYQDTKTTQTIARDYVFQGTELRKEFFLIIHTGSEDNKEVFFLTSEQISQNFDLNDKNKYSIYGKNVLIDQFNFTHRKRKLLDKIERVLETTEFKKNKLNLEYFLNIQINENDILEDFDFPINNSIMNIKETFFEYKEKIRSQLWDLEDMINKYQKGINTNDPKEFYKNVIEGIHEDYPELDIEPKYCHHEDFYEAMEEHENKLKTLKENNKDKEYLHLYSVLLKNLDDLKSKIDLSKEFINIKINIEKKSIDIISEDSQREGYSYVHKNHKNKVEEIICLNIQKELYAYLTSK